ncbi:MAG: hypothetical protein R3F14_01055 [Polyangiaceae bacterium]
MRLFLRHDRRDGGAGATAGTGGTPTGGTGGLPCTPVDDANDCTADLCEGHYPGQHPLPLGTPCSRGVCDGEGACVECNDSADCQSSFEMCPRKTPASPSTAATPPRTAMRPTSTAAAACPGRWPRLPHRR